MIETTLDYLAYMSIALWISSMFWVYYVWQKSFYQIKRQKKGIISIIWGR